MVWVGPMATSKLLNSPSFPHQRKVPTNLVKGLLGRRALCMLGRTLNFNHSVCIRASKIVPKKHKKHHTYIIGPYSLLSLASMIVHCTPLHYRNFCTKFPSLLKAHTHIKNKTSLGVSTYTWLLLKHTCLLCMVYLVSDGKV